MKTKHILTIITLAVIGALASTLHAESAQTGSNAAQTWTCSMHPQIQQAAPGDCPICGMDLIPLTKDAPNDAGPRELSMSEAAKALAEIQTSPVIRAQPMHTLSLVGQLQRAETKIKSQTARFPARIESLAVDSVGITVSKGQTLAHIYSPELLAAQGELLTAYQRDPDGQFTQIAREKLLQWGILPEQITAMLEAGAAKQTFELRSPIDGVVVSKNIHQGDYVKTGQALYTLVDLSELWLELEAYESDLPWLKNGQRVRFTTQAIPGKSFQGEINFIEPEIDARTRTATVRVVVPNGKGQLMPGMYARAQVMAPQAEEALLIPASAVLRTGQRAVVYVAVPNKERPTYEGREVLLGAKADDQYIVRSGLTAGEQVVSNGAFKIDSALQIQAKPSMMSMPSEKHHTDNDPWAVLVSEYFQLQAALAQDDFPASKQALQAMMGITGHSGEAADLIHKMLAADSLEAIRRPHFETLSQHIITAVEASPETWDTPLYRMHCPMVYGDHGADWLQNHSELLNPYFGAMMLHCGTAIEMFNFSHKETE